MTTPALECIVTDRLWRFARPIWFSGIRLRAYTTIVRLDDGALLVHSPAVPSDEALAELRALGEVRWLVVPNAFHHLGTPAAAALFPAARVVGPASAVARSKALALHLDLASDEFAAGCPDLERLPLDGLPFLDETVLYHRPTRTLLATDMILSACRDDHWTTRTAGRLFGFYQRARVPPDAKKHITDRAAIARSVAAMLARPAERLLVAHAPPLDAGWRDQLVAAWAAERVAVAAPTEAKV